MQRGHGLVLAASALTFTVGLGGCIVERSYEAPAPIGAEAGFDLERSNRVDNVEDVDDVVVDEVDGQRLIEGAVGLGLAGDIGPVRDIRESTPLVSVYDDGWFAAIESVAVVPDRAAMLLLSVSNPGEALAPGARTWTFNEQSGDTQLIAVGCAGADVGYYDEFDLPADEVDVVVEETPEPGEVIIQATARWTTAFPEVRTATSSWRVQRSR
jgi:hypothetical protein